MGTKYITYFKNFNKYKYLLSLFVKRDIKRKYKGSYLGILWSMMNPLLQMIVLSIVFSTLFDSDIDNFPVYMLCGYLIFQFFSMSTMQALGSIVHSAHLISKVYLPKYIVTISTIISNFIFFLISLVVLLVVMLVTNADITVNVLYVPLYLILLFFFCCGLSLILATAMVFFRDIEHIYSVIMTIISFTSAIFYPTSIIPDEFKIVLELNPILYYIEGFRQILYNGLSPDIYNLLVCFGISVVTMILGLVIFEKNQRKFILYI